MKIRVFSGKVLFINLAIWVFFRKLHYHFSSRSDNLSSKENVFQPKGFDLLPVFRSLCEVHLEQQEQIVGHHHQLKDRFIDPK